MVFDNLENKLVKLGEKHNDLREVLKYFTTYFDNSRAFDYYKNYLEARHYILTKNEFFEAKK
jgi:hypothetical protein